MFAQQGFFFSVKEKKAGGFSMLLDGTKTSDILSGVRHLKRVLVWVDECSLE